MSSSVHSSHILPTSANLLGFTFVVLTSIRGLGLSSNSTVANLTGACVIMFALSTLLSFMSIRSSGESMINYERWAEWVFIAALITCVILSGLLAFDLA